MTKTGIRPVQLWQPEVRVDHRADGSVLVWQAGDLPTYPDRLSDRIAHWVSAAPDRLWMAERGADGAWQGLTYSELWQQMRAVGQVLLDLDLSVDRPLIILSGNSVAHAVVALAAQYVGIPSAAIAPAYSFVGAGYEKLRDIRAQITPGAVFVDRMAPFATAIAAVFPDLPVLSQDGALRWSDIVQTVATPAVDRANAATGPVTVAKFMFTSGTTGSPKAVIQTQRMLCANQVMVADCFQYFQSQPPVVLDWAPWNHVASGSKVFNMVLYNGGTFYIDGGKPTAQHIGQTIANLKSVSPTWYFNVPAGFDMLIEAMKADRDLAEGFFREVQVLMYAGASMAAHTWAELEELAVQTVGHRILMCSGLGATETAPAALYSTLPQSGPGNIGIPVKGLTLKLVPTDGKWEARVKGPSVTPGYWRNPDLTGQAFDDEGYYCLGDALRWADPQNAGAGFFFDGRVAENFKMSTGTWVAVGALRAAVTNALAGLARDVVIAGEGRGELAALIVPFRPACERVIADGAAMPDEAVFDHPAVRARLAELLSDYNAGAGGASLRIGRAAVLMRPLSIDLGEVTDKGSVNQRAVLRHRADLVEALYATEGGNLVVTSAG